MVRIYSSVTYHWLSVMLILTLVGCSSGMQAPPTPTASSHSPTAIPLSATPTLFSSPTPRLPTATAIAPATIGAESLLIVAPLEGDNGTVTTALVSALSAEVPTDSDMPLRIAMLDIMTPPEEMRDIGASYQATLVLYGSVGEEGISLTLDSPTDLSRSVPTANHNRFFPGVYLPTRLTRLPTQQSTYVYLAQVAVAIERSLIGKMESAVAIMEAATTEDEPLNRAHAHFYLGNWYENYQGEYTAAVAQLEIALAQDPELAEAYILRGQLHHAHYERDQARIAYDRAISLRPDMAVGYFARAIAEIDWYEFEAAHTDLTQALSLRPLTLYSQWEAYLQCYGSGFNYRILVTTACTTAREQIQEVIDRQPEEATHYLTYAYVQDVLGDPAAHLTALNQAVELEPTYAEAYLRRATYYRDQGDTATAATNAARARELRPSAFDAANPNMKDIYPEATLATLDAYITDNPWSARAYYERFRYHFALEDYTQALADITKALEIQPYGVAYYYWRSETYRELGDWAGWDADMKAALMIVPGYVNTLDSATTTFINRQDYMGGLAFLASEKERTSDNGAIYFNEGRLYDEQGAYEQAITAYDRAIELLPAPNYYYRRGRTYALLENYDNAVIEYLKAIDLAPSPYYLYYSKLCEANALRGQYLSAVGQCTKAIDLNNEDYIGYYYRGYARYYRYNYAEARADFERVIDLDQDGSWGTSAREWLGFLNE